MQLSETRNSIRGSIYLMRLATICAGGSRATCQNKNLRLLSGRPLVIWTMLRKARASGLFDNESWCPVTMMQSAPRRSKLAQML